MKPEWDTPEVQAARDALADVPSMAVADLNLRVARTSGRAGRARERRIDAALREIVLIHYKTAERTLALVKAREKARGE